MPTEADFPVKRKEGPEHAVARLFYHQKDNNGTLYFQIKWADYEDSTWELRDCIRRELF